MGSIAGGPAPASPILEYSEMSDILKSDWLTTEEAANLTGYHPDHLRRLWRAGRIEGCMLGHSLLISRASLLAHKRKARAGRPKSKSIEGA